MYALDRCWRFGEKACQLMHAGSWDLISTYAGRFIAKALFEMYNRAKNMESKCKSGLLAF